MQLTVTDAYQVEISKVFFANLLHQLAITFEICVDDICNSLTVYGCSSSSDLNDFSLSTQSGV